MFRPKRYFDFMRLWVLLTGFIWTTVALPHTAAAQDTVEPANNTVWTTTLASPNPNNFDTPNIMSALSNPHSDLVMLSAHRGIHALAGLNQAPGVPENSLQSIGLAAQEGWEMIELDVKLTSDGVPILSHDKTWGREWCGLGSIFLPGSSNPYDPFTPPGSIFNDPKNPAVNGTLLSDTRSFLGNTVLRDSVSLLNAFNNHGCNSVNNVFGEYPPTLADALDYIAKNHIRMVVLLDIQGLDIAQAALSVVASKSDDLGRSFLQSSVFKMPMSVFPNGTSDFVNTFGNNAINVNFIPVINTADVAPTTATITDMEDGGFDVTDFGNNGFGGESGIVARLKQFESTFITTPNGDSDLIQIPAVEVNLKEPNGILTQTVLPAARMDATGRPMTVGAFNPVGEFYPNGDTTQTPQFFRSSNGSCCDILNQYLYNNPNGTGPIDPSQPVDHSDQRTNPSMFINQGFQYLITDDPSTVRNLLQQRGKRNICYMEPTPLPNCKQAGTIDVNGWYNVVNVNSGLCADVFAWGTDLGNSLDQWQCGNDQANQQWQFTSVGNGLYQVSSRFVAMSWNVTGGVGATGNQVPIQLWSYGGASNEQWQAVLLQIDSNGNGVYKLIAQNSGLCLDVPSASMSNGQQLDQFSCNGTNAQAFTLVPVNPAPVNTVAPTAAAPAPPPTPNPNAWYDVVNINSGSCLDIFDFGTALGTALDQWTCGNGQANQQWQFTPVGNGIYQVSSRFVAMSWNVTGGTGATRNQTPIQLWSYGGNSNEQWKATYLSTDSNGNNVYQFIAQNDGLCLDVPGASNLNGQQLDQFACNGTNAQAFTLVQVTPAASTPVAPTASAPPPPPPPSPNASLWYNVVNVNSGSCLDVFDFGTALGTALDQWQCGNGQANQQWQFTPTGNGAYQVSSRLVSMSWNVSGGTGAISNAAPIQLWSYDGASNEQWKAIYLSTNSSGNNVYQFIAQNDGLCLDVPGASSVNGLQLDQFFCNGTNAQAFTLVQVTPASVNPVAPTAPAPPPPPQPNPNLWYKVVNVNNGSCVDVFDFGTALGSALDQWTCGNGQANQQWQFSPTGNGSFQVSSRFVAMSWNVTGGVGATGNQVPIQLWSYGTGSSNEQWKAIYLSTDSNGNNVYRFVAQNDGLCLDVPGASNATGLQLDQFTCNGTNAQAFTLVQVSPASGNPVTPTTPAPPPAPQPNPNSWYQVVNVNDGSCVDVSNWGTALGTALDQWTCGNGQANQQWQFTPTGVGSFQVSSRFVSMSWDVTGGVGATQFQVPIQLWSYGGASNEQWKAVYLSTDSNGNNVYRFVAQNDGLCLDVPGASTANGKQLDQYSCNGTNAQAFTLVQVTPASGNPVAPTAPPPPPIPQPNPNSWYQVVNVNDGSCVDVSNWGTSPSTALDQWTCGNGQANQQWQFTSVGNDSYYVSSRFVAMSWDVTGGVTAWNNQVPIQLWPYGGASNEQWRAVYLWTDGNGNNVYRFVAQNDGLCLDVPGSSATNGLQLDQYSCNGTNAQAFTLVQVNPAAGNPVAPTFPFPTTPQPQPQPQHQNYTAFDTSGAVRYQIQNKGSNLCVDIFGGAPHGRLTQWPCNFADQAQQWWFIPANPWNSAYVVVDYRVNSNVWDVAGGTSVNWDGAGIDVYDNQWALNEQWIAVQQSDFSFNFVSVSDGKCLDVPNSSHSPGVTLDQWDCNGTDAQKFWVNGLGSPGANGGSGGLPPS